DLYPGGPVQGPSPWNGGQIGNVQANPTADLFTYSTVFSGALTAATYGSQALSPTNPMPAGRYAIMGAKVSSITNYAILRFIHGDFGQYTPGFPVTDVNQTIARANTVLDPIFTVAAGHQFTYMS